MESRRLDEREKELLAELSLNARASITELAKKTNLSKQVVSYKLSQLEKEKIILGYHAITNIYLLGKTHYRVFVKYQNISSQKEEEIIDYLVKKEEVVWATQFDGDFDMAFLVWAENIQEFEKIFDEINEKYGRYFQEKYFSIATKIEYLSYRFLKNKKMTSLIFGDCFGHYKIDKTDSKILNELNKKGRETLVELAGKCNTSAKVIKLRVDKLKRNKIILGFNIQLDNNLLGYTHRKVFLKLNDVSKEVINNLSEYLRKQKSTIYLVKPIGDFDFEFEVMTESNEEFHHIIKDLRSNFPKEIKNYKSVIHYKEPKSGQSFRF